MSGGIRGVCFGGTVVPSTNRLNMALYVPHREAVGLNNGVESYCSLAVSNVLVSSSARSSQMMRLCWTDMSHVDYLPR